MSELPVYHRYPLTIERGEGCRLYTDDGRELIDFYGGHATALLGYGHPKLVAALEDQARTLFFQTNAVELDVRTRAAERLARFAPAALTKVFFVNSGAEANENALRVACRVTGRDHVVAVRGGFHGRTSAAAACTDGSEAWYGFARTPFDVTWVEPNDRAALEGAVGDTTAAVIVEPIQGMGGARVLEDTFLGAIRDVTRERGALFIADEIQCGMGRSGEPFAIARAGVDVDLLTTAKGIAGGFPAAALLLSDEIAAHVKPGDLGTTFGGGPLAARLIETVIDCLEAPGFLEGVRAREAQIRDQCPVGPVTAIQGRGLLLGLRVSRSAKEINSLLLEQGILAAGAKDPHIVRLIPPLTIDEAAVDALARALERIPA